jgi:hypothetical protein
MEEFLNKVHTLKDCFSQFSYQQVMGMDKLSLQNLCLAEKISLNEHLHSDKMKTKNVTIERLNIIKNQTASEKAQRLEFLNSQFGGKK